MLDGQETELEIIDHPAAEMSVSKNATFLLGISKNNGAHRGDASRGQLPPTNCVKRVTVGYRKELIRHSRKWSYNTASPLSSSLYYCRLDAGVNPRDILQYKSLYTRCAWTGGKTEGRRCTFMRWRTYAEALLTRKGNWANYFLGFIKMNWRQIFFFFNV